MRKLIAFVLLVIVASGCNKGRLRPVPIPYYFKNVLFLGNSLTFAPPGHTHVWDGYWGMAATVQDSDYVHILTRKFVALNPGCVTAVQNTSEFEIHTSVYDFDTELKSYRDNKPDLIIIQMGEEVAAGFDRAYFNQRYAELLAYLRTGNPKVEIFAFGSFWTGRSAVDSIMRHYTPFISLSNLGRDRSNYAWGTFPDSTVQAHPGNKGMKAISTMMWRGIDSLRQTLDARDK
ncbi:SGNH/GDSL hydrolase family protein [Mucilaginibacter panaciglaebae]|uniref:SGNH/GDSL hydrolase family protein n=1 Tax=Mucilaginibacter panaciglaebae TaxID=502331 RepID=UPI0031E54668